MGLLMGLMLIFGGLILAMGILTSIPALGKHLEKLAKWLGRFQTIIGIVLIVLAIWYMLSGIGLTEIVALLAGLVLAMGILPSIPALGKSLEKVAKWLGRFQTIIGIIAIIVGILELL
jgi:cytochrome c biogenesis protein CcdA